MREPDISAPPGNDPATFRAETVAWLEANYPLELRGVDDTTAIWGGRKQRYAHPAQRRWLELAAERGWTAPTWPREFGGGGLSATEAAIVAEEIRRYGARPPIVRMNQGLILLGPVLLEFGTEQQKARFLPPIARGEVRWCQGYSEPAAGSDLANIRTRAERDGHVYRVNGHKTWSSYAHLSDWIFCLVRTDPVAAKQAGISFLLIELDDPHIRVEPITLISGKSDFCEVFLTDVEVPADQLVGEPGQGWPIAKRLLQHERSMLGSAGNGLSGGTRRRTPLVDLARTAIEAQKGSARGAVWRDLVAEHLISTRALKAATQAFADARRSDPHLASLVKLVSTELNMRRQDLVGEIAGLDVAGWDGEFHDDDQLARAREWLRSRANSIEGGTSEIQLNIIAKQGLRLP